MSGDSPPSSGQTNLFEAIQQRFNQSVVCELISACPDVNITGGNSGKTALFYAVTTSNYESVVRALIDAGADVNTIDIMGKTALFDAVQQSNNESVVRTLINAGADVNRTDNGRRTALFDAVQQSNNESVVRTLINAGADVNRTDKVGKTVLFYAFQKSNNENVVRALIDAGADVNKTNHEGKTALHYACERMQNREIGIGIVQAMIDAGADVNKPDKYDNVALLYARNESLVSAFVYAPGADVNTTDASGQTALFYAVQLSNNENVVRALIHAGADVNKTDKDGRTALFYACRVSTNEVVVRALIDANTNVKITDNDGQTALFYAVETRNNERVVRKLIDSGSDVNLTDKHGKTALFYAVGEKNNERVVCELIDSGTDLNITDNDGRTVLLQAIQKRYDESVILALIDASTDVNTTDNKGKTALFHALQQRINEDVVRKLIDAGADVNTTDANGETAWYYAVCYVNESVVSTFIHAGADVNKTLNNGHTALFYAVRSGNERVISTLIDAGADVNITDDSGKTLLFHAVECYNGNVLRTLIKAGADVNKTDESGNTALLYALKSRGYKDMICTLIDGGADVNIADHDGKTALFYAVCEDSVRCSDNESVVRALIGAGAKVDMTDRSGKTPLICAIQERNENVVLALIVASTDLNKADYFGRTALFYAVQRYNSEKIVQALIKAGADVKKTDKSGQTALFYAVQQRNNENVVRAVVDADNNILNIRDIYGRTALLYINYNSPEVFAYLLEKGGKRCLQLKDNCNVNIVTLVIEDYLSETGTFMEDNDPKVLGELPKQGLAEREGVAKEIINIMFRKYISNVLKCHSTETQAAPQNLKTFKGLAKLYKEYVDNNVWQRKKKMESLITLLEQEFRNTTEIIKVLIELGADPDSADSDGNTALHYATRLPLSSASQDLVMDVCHHLKELEVRFNTKNHQDQTPLLFGLAFDTPHMTESVLQSVVDVCIFLLNNGSSIEETSRTGESVFHFIVKLFQEGLKLHEKAREEVLRDLFRLLQWFPTAEVETSMAVNRLDKDLNSPLHLWAHLTLPSPQDYSSSLTEDHTLFEDILKLIFDILLKCGAKLNPRNENEDTPLHVCKTWAAVKLLIKAGVNTNDLNSSKRSPLLVAAKNNSFTANPACFYPDVSQEKKSFWKETLEMGLDPWTADKHDESVLSILVESEAYLFAKSLVDVACEDSYTKSEAITISLLNALCKDKSIRTNWKANLVRDILKSRKSSTSLSIPLRYCCENVIETGVRVVKQEDKTDSAVAESLAEGDDDDAPPPKRRRTDESDGKSEAQADLYQGPVTVHCEIIKLLRWYGAGGEACEEIAKEYSQLSDLLLKPLTDDQIQEFIPWTSVSKKYEDKLAKVARRQEFEMLQQIWYHRDQIGSGSFGLIFAGINEKDGREVAIKRIERLRLRRPEDKREIQNLTALADCQQVVRYLSFCEDQHFCYIVLELMEGNLEEYLDESIVDATEATVLCKDVVMGLKFLHEQNILHRDLKPQNILYKKHPKLCLKIADFGLSRRIDSTSTTVYGTNAGTKCWIAPEILKSPPKDHSKSSDMFSCGLLLHYILSGQEHPFCPADCANKSETQVAHETEDNLMKGKMEGWDNSLFPEASHLVGKMMENTIKNRPTAEEAIDHPLFWTKEKKIDLLIAVGNQTEFECPRTRRGWPWTAVEKDLENSVSTIVKYRSWNDPGYLHMPAIYAEMRKRRSYDTRSAVELVRLIRNTYAHISSKKTPAPKVPMNKILLEDFVFLEYFPALVMEVYKAVTTHGWDQSRDEIKFAMNK